MKNQYHEWRVARRAPEPAPVITMPKPEILFGSVCSGIEAASVAWHPIGWRAAWLAEIEPFPSAVLAHHYPTVPNLGDMTQLPDRIATGEVVAPDVFCGGTPCQAFSVAGLRRSLNDARGNLSLVFCEIANAIDAARQREGKPPAVIFWENVPGVFSTADNAFGCFLAGLAGEDEPLVAPGGKWTNAGYVSGPKRAVAWRVLDAQYFGVAQRRRRVFVVASARNDFDPLSVLFESEGVRRDLAPRRESWEDAPDGSLRSTDGGSDVDHVRTRHIVGPLTAACGPNGHGGSGLATDKGAEAGHILAFGGNRTSGPIDVATALNACSSASGRLDFESETFVTHSASVTPFDLQQVTHPENRSRIDPGMPAPTLAKASRLHAAISFHPTQDSIFSEDGSVHALGCGSKGGTATAAVAVPQGDDDASTYEGDAASTLRALRREVGKEAVAEWGSRVLDSLQSPEVLRAWLYGESLRRTSGDFKSFVDDRPLSRAEGVVARAMRRVWEEGPDGRTPQGRGLAKQLAFQLGKALPVLPHPGAQSGSLIVRRLTPKEAERLQGFPDDYTAISWRGKPAGQCPDGPRYKALGNSWAVPVVRWIGRRINARLSP